HCLLTLSSLGVTEFLELGPGAVLTGMAKRTVESARTISIATPEDLDKLLNPGFEIMDTARQRPMADPTNPSRLLVEQLPTGEWIERAPSIEAVAVAGDGVFDTLKAVSKLVLKSLASSS
ncbi:MAG: hypothetical protein LH616_13730, partial [Ilumatobacteraceae bacterium]|nr:hypothetical protein [Ilumatobacteraceae bacterium]